MTQKKSEHAKKGSAEVIGFGLTAAAAAAAGAYFLYGSKKASQNRKKVKSWALKAKAEVLEGIEKAQELTEDDYKKLVETATSAFGTVKNATKGEVADFKKEMLTHWNDLQKSKVLKKIIVPVVARKIAKKAAAPKKKAAPRKPRAKKTSSEPKAA